MWKKLVAYFKPQKSIDNTDEHRSESIFINVLLITLILDLIGFQNSNAVGLEIISFLLLINSIGCVILLFLYKYGKINIVTATHFHSAQHAISFGCQAWFQGGLSSPAMAAFFLLPGLAMLMAGRKTSTIWFVICLLIIFGYYLYELNNGSPQPYYGASDRLPFFLSAVVGTYVSIFVILMVYESGKSSALKELQQKHDDLISTQERLIQSEKLASLGELTAGIAHEIQNPLNFVNNFSEVSGEILEELVDELKNNNQEAADDIITDLQGNLEKINFHGKRASDIVKGMLAHSRKNTGQKEMVDINLLADEYLRLAYHGFRAKDKVFKSEFSTDLEVDLPQISVVSQDIGRVLLNLINNAFYAVSNKYEHLVNSEGYVPEVKIKTQKIENQLLIFIIDNGNGIPDEIKEKIFQPFFTTKPTGKGTGLGLSLAYDIIHNHGGELKVDSSLMGTTFSIMLPYS